MAYSSKRFKDSWKDGGRAENIFKKILKKFDKHARAATREEQFRHIDFISAFGSFDVKAQKRLNRSDANKQDEFVWLEFKNTLGNRGWLYGDADYIAFERDDSFLIIKKIYIQGLAKTLCDTNDKVSKASEALYKGYTRKDRKDLISMVRVEDLESLPHEVWKKIV